MRKKNDHLLEIGLGSWLLFAVWTVLIRFVDVKPAGPGQSRIGFAAWNVWFHKMTGVHMRIYILTDWLGLVPVLICACFGMMGLVQWIQRKRLMKVDPDIILLGIYYILVIAGYLFFEMIPVNFRPILINGILEASYPSSTTLLVLSVMPTLKFQTDRRCGNRFVRTASDLFVICFSGGMVIGRLLAGVHWFTDIVGAVLLSLAFFCLYAGTVRRIDCRRGRKRGIL